MGHVLVVDDDVTVREVVASYLRAHGHGVEESSDGADALRRIGRADGSPTIDLVVLDRMLPEVDGEEVCRRVRLLPDRRADLPIIMLTGLGEAGQRVAGLEAGADDYVTKPFSPRELALRVDSVLRRTGGWREAESDAPLADGDLVVDVRRHQATRSGHAIALTGREFDLLAFLLANPGVAWSREELMARVWGWSVGDLSTVTVHVRRLREKIEADPRKPVRLATVWGVGYRWDTTPAGEGGR